MTTPEGDAASFSGGDLDRRRARERLEDAQRLDQACNGLARSHPEFSIRAGLAPSQRSGLWSLAGALIVTLIMAPATLAEAVTLGLSSLFAVVIFLRLAAAIAALTRVKPPIPPPEDFTPLPVVTVLIPLYKEANMVEGLLKTIREIDYPVQLLDVKFLLEADDPLTIAAVEGAKLPMYCDMVVLPPCQPRTKPKALNYGLSLARGEIVCIFDAEDRPAPQQVRAAVECFRSGPADLAVVQAPLLTHNGGASWIAGQFQIEYAIHFRVWLPFIQRMGWLLPLGGTSNYFRRSALDDAGGWDPWNVTEDADLGIRLARLDGHAAMIDAPTMEEGPSRIEHWVAQRTRWMKGHVQTWLVLMRDPFGAARQLGLFGFLGLQLTFGASLVTALAHLPLLILLCAGLVHPAIELQGWHGALFGVGYGSVLAAALATREARPSFWRLISLPLYWPLTSLAMYLALWEMRTKPHVWAKTPHGVSGPS